jgi:hypothetical protein
MAHRNVVSGAIALALALAGCGEAMESQAGADGPDTTGMAGMQDGNDDDAEAGDGSGGPIEPDAGSTSGIEPDGPASSSESGDPPDEGSTGEEPGGSTEETGDGVAACVDDDQEDNDVLGFPASWDGTSLGLRSCDDDPDWFQVIDDKVTEVHLEQATGISPSGDPFANLVLEAYCGQERCDVDDSKEAEKRVTFDACRCPEGERRFIHVAAGEPANPPGGTRYGLGVP